MVLPLFRLRAGVRLIRKPCMRAISDAPELIALAIRDLTIDFWNTRSGNAHARFFGDRACALYKCYATRRDPMKRQKFVLEAMVVVALTAVQCFGWTFAAEDQQLDPKDFPRFELTPVVDGLFRAGGLHARMAYNYLRYANALVLGGDALDEVVSRDIVLNDLLPMGFAGLAGLKEFRQQRNAAMSYDRALLMSIEFPSDDITNVDLCTERTDPATGNKFVFIIHAKDRWVDDMVVERWHSAEPQADGSNCTELAGSR